MIFILESIKITILGVKNLIYQNNNNKIERKKNHQIFYLIHF
jgi:hypothetical protein